MAAGGEEVLAVKRPFLTPRVDKQYQKLNNEHGILEMGNSKSLYYNDQEKIQSIKDLLSMIFANINKRDNIYRNLKKLSFFSEINK